MKLNLVKPNRTGRRKDNYTAGIVKYNKSFDLFYILIKDKLYNVNAYLFNDVKILYSKPNNMEYEDWTSKSHTGILDKRFPILSLYWAVIKHNMNVRGIIEDDIFIIKKY